MSLRKLADSPIWHFPPSMIVLDPGNYEHTCPGCGRITLFIVPDRPMPQPLEREWYGDRGFRKDPQLEKFQDNYGTMCSASNKPNGHHGKCDCPECFEKYDLGCCGM